MRAEKQSGVDRRRSILTDSQEVTTNDLQRARERLQDPTKRRVIFDGIHGVPGVACVVTSVDESKSFTVGGVRIATADALLKGYRQASPEAQQGSKILSLYGMPVDTVAATVLEAQGLSKDMTNKAAAVRASLAYSLLHHPHIYPPEVRANADAWMKASDFHGSKSVISVDYPPHFAQTTQEQRYKLMQQHAEHMNHVNTRNGELLDPDIANEGAFTAPDMGTNLADMNVVRNHTKWVTTQSGEPSPSTAIGVMHGINATLKVLEKDGNKVSFAMQGAGGAVGSDLLRLIRQQYPDATLYINDIVSTEQLAKDYDAIPVPQEEIFGVGDMFVPSGPPAQLNDESLETMSQAGVQAVVGPANSIYPAGRDDLIDTFFNKKILVVPAYLANQGGIRFCTQQFIEKHSGIRPSVKTINASLADIGPMTEHVLRQGVAQGIAPERVFEKIVLREYAASCKRRDVFTSN